jgi:hypothetical protein
MLHRRFAAVGHRNFHSFYSGPLLERAANRDRAGFASSPDFEFQYTSAALSLSHLHMQFELRERVLLFGDREPSHASFPIAPQAQLTIASLVCDMVWMEAPSMGSSENRNSVKRRTSCVIPSAVFEAFPLTSLERLISVGVSGSEVRCSMRLPALHSLCFLISVPGFSCSARSICGSIRR